MKTIAIVALALALSSAAVACSPSQTSARPATTTTSAAQLDGLRFAATAKLPNGESMGSELSFAQGMFDSTTCHQFGYTAGKYTVVSREGNAVVFRADMPGKDGVNTWNGRIVGDKVSGTVTGPDGVTISFTGIAE